MPSSVHSARALTDRRVLEASLERQRQRCVHATAERRVQADAPVADLVAKALDHDGAVVGH